MTENTKAPYQISEYLEYCDCVGKQPNQRLIEFRNQIMSRINIPKKCVMMVN